MAETFAHTVPEEAHASHAHHPELSFFRKYIWSEDHKTIALQYLFTSMFFLAGRRFAGDGSPFSVGFPECAGAFHRDAAAQLVGDFFRSISARRLQRAGDHACDGHGLSGHHAVFDRSVRELPDPAQDRGAGHGFPFLQRTLLLALSPFGSGLAVQLFRSGRFPGQRMDLLRSALVARSVQRNAGRPEPLVCRSLYQRPGFDRRCDELHHHGHQYAGTRDDDVPIAASGLGAFHHRDSSSAGGPGSFGSRRHAVL